ncbi:MAG: LSU ribosomal protein L30p (L7e), partial [uncultured Sphingomonadaceae bacterium]
ARSRFHRLPACADRARAEQDGPFGPDRGHPRQHGRDPQGCAHGSGGNGL